MYLSISTVPRGPAYLYLSIFISLSFFILGKIQSDQLARQPPLPSDQLPPPLQWQQPEHVALERQQSLGQQRQLVHHQQTSNDLDKEIDSFRC